VVPAILCTNQNYYPSVSWIRLLANLDDHFGEMIELDDDSKKAIADYLKSNSAEYSSANRVVKIMEDSQQSQNDKLDITPHIGGG
jgi:diheme cytochrome c